MAELLLLLVSVFAFLLALSGMGHGWTVTAIPLRRQFSLRFLFLLMAVGPPFIGLGWAHREKIRTAFVQGDRQLIFANKKPTPRKTRTTVRATSTTQSLKLPYPSNRRMAIIEEPPEERLSKQELDDLNRLSAIGTGAFSSISVLFLASAFRKSRGWRHPPRQSPLTWIALFFAILAAAAFAGFVLTLTGYAEPKDPFGGY
jgi:hypothetical protein